MPGESTLDYLETWLVSRVCLLDGFDFRMKSLPDALGNGSAINLCSGHFERTAGEGSALRRRVEGRSTKRQFLSPRFNSEPCS
jgi:hypothetical protein